jgi:hypothetical protein
LTRIGTQLMLRVKFSFMKNTHLFKSKLRIALVLTFVVGLASFNLMGWQSVSAAVLTNSSFMEYNMATSGQGNIAIAFKGATASATSVSINLNPSITGITGLLTGSGSSVSSSGIAVTGTGCTTYFPLATAVPSPSAPTYSSPNVSFTTTALSNSTEYCAIITSTAGLIINPSVASTYGVTITAGSISQTDIIDVISSDTYTVTGIIGPTFTLSLLSGSDTFTGNLSSTAITSTSGVTAQVNTNAATGWFLWAADTQHGLYSTQQAKLIPSVTAGSSANMTTNIGSEDYALGVTSVTSGAATTAYADAGGTTGGGLTTAATGFNEIASNSSPTTANDNVVIKELADIASTTPPATDYSDIVTIVGAGSF